MVIPPKPSFSLTTTIIFAVVILSHARAAIGLVEQFEYLGSWCSGDNFTLKSPYQQNLRTLLSSLESNAFNSSNGFYASNTTATSGEAIYAALLCRGDATPASCEACVANATAYMPPIDCPSDKTAVVWYNKCMVRYSNVPFLGEVDENAFKNIKNKNNISSNDNTATEFLALVAKTLNDLENQLSFGNNQGVSGATKKYYGTKQAFFANFITLYTMAQCSPDLSSTHCFKCLSLVNDQIARYCNVSQGCRILNPSCNIRYEIYSFDDGSGSDSPTSPTPVARSKGRHTSVVVKIVVGIGVLLLVVLLAILFYIHHWRKEKKDVKNSNGFRSTSNHTPIFETDGVDFSRTTETLLYDFTTLQNATNNFDEYNKLGEGGFGTVYKGILPNGQELAVKRLSKDSNQGAEQFKNEVVFVANLQHRNLVRLLGYSLTQDEKLLIYEFVPNKSLDIFLFDARNRGQLDWPTRYKIIQGIARGILYLHEDSRLKIVHRDVKASNILLDAEMNPKISDFGLARNFQVNQKHDVTGRPAGTFGYMAPEYLEYGEFSVQSDVYSFGVLVLEIISGRRINNRSSGNLLTFAWKNWIEDTPNAFVDSSLGESYSRNEVMRCMHLGLFCVQGDMEARPSMISIVSYLNSDLILPTPQEPSFWTCSTKLSRIVTEEQVSDDKFDKTRSTSTTSWIKSPHSISGNEAL